VRPVLTMLSSLAFVATAAGVQAEQLPTRVTLTLKDHKFTPAVLTVAAAQSIRIELINRDSTAEELDSEDLHLEKDVAPHGKVIVQIGPLKPGTYSFMGELHADSAQGKVIAVATP
jgi:hypothetical protein